MTRLLGPKDLKARGVDFSPKTLEKLESAGQFPKRAHLSERKPVWVAEEIEDYVNRRIAARG